MLKPHRLSQIHIEVARNSTDDFNLFHDKNRWNWIKHNPFNGPIALGFQLGCFIETQMEQTEIENHEQQQLHRDDFPFSAFELTFAGVVVAGDELHLDVKSGKHSQNQNGKLYSNRLLLKANDKAVILGFKRESEFNTVLLPAEIPLDVDWGRRADRSFHQSSGCFLKRKYMIVGNAKNFLTSAFAEQSHYIDEFSDRVKFPQMYPLSLVSSALLERAQAIGHDLVKNPMIYASHKLCIDKKQLASLKSNDVLNIVVSPETKVEGDQQKVSHVCVGYVQQNTPLFTAQIVLLPLASIVGA
ncbi:hypothetical protein [Aliiglaciecola sp. LCG003]|uniref:hypothetical protein n=1 Tax=Aliiglaciecola sp. LCG003 TaxID=3053655 RepID=UPI0025727580|nr:hypothetical protein [Aliiglaciecola sp. LCG003]WJG08461.1 hypothetical protein QR722_14090 [Aliiglaciecola sp. LCG003]